jgi:hypothetical protein
MGKRPPSPKGIGGEVRDSACEKELGRVRDERDALKAVNEFHKKALEEWNRKAEERLDTINALKAALERIAELDEAWVVTDKDARVLGRGTLSSMNLRFCWRFGALHGWAWRKRLAFWRHRRVFLYGKRYELPPGL